MIGSFISKKIIEALYWDGFNRVELEDFFGKENIVWTYYSNKPAVPEVFGKKIEQNNYVILNGEKDISVFEKFEFESLYEKV